MKCCKSHSLWWVFLHHEESYCSLAGALAGLGTFTYEEKDRNAPDHCFLGTMRNHKLIQVCRLLRLIILTDKFCHVLKTLCSGKKMQPTLAMVAFNLLFIKGERDAEGIAVVLPVPQGPQFWLQNLLVESTAGPRGSTTASQQVPYPPSLSLQIKLLQMPSLNPMGWQ